MLPKVASRKCFSLDYFRGSLAIKSKGCKVIGLNRYSSSEVGSEARTHKKNVVRSGDG